MANQMQPPSRPSPFKSPAEQRYESFLEQLSAKGRATMQKHDDLCEADAAQGYGSVTLAASTSCENCVYFENNAPILILRDPKEPFLVLWTQAKHYD